MHVAVLSSAESWYYRDLQRAAGDAVRLTAVGYARLAAVVDEQGLQVRAGECALAACDAVLIRSMPPAALEPIVFRMDVLGRLAAEGQVVVNSPRSIEAAVDKFLTTALLADAGLLVPPTQVCQSVDDAMEAFHQLGGDVVVKPLFGGEGRGLTRVTDEAIAWRVFQTLAPLGAVLYLQQFLPHPGEDWRLLVVGDEVFGMRRRHPHDWRTNIGRGAVGQPLVVTPELAELAHRAAAAVGAAVAGVDVLPDQHGRLVVLEVNGVPGWKALAAVTGVDVAQRVLAYLRTRRR
jgi:ribosomal protein S6--L-glutamate ligase